jgi:hypothetical protein
VKGLVSFAAGLWVFVFFLSIIPAARDRDAVMLFAIPTIVVGLVAGVVLAVMAALMVGEAVYRIL